MPSPLSPAEFTGSFYSAIQLIDKLSPYDRTEKAVVKAAALKQLREGYPDDIDQAVDRIDLSLTEREGDMREITGKYVALVSARDIRQVLGEHPLYIEADPPRKLGPFRPSPLGDGKQHNAAEGDGYASNHPAVGRNMNIGEQQANDLKGLAAITKQAGLRKRAHFNRYCEIARSRRG